MTPPGWPRSCATTPGPTRSSSSRAAILGKKVIDARETTALAELPSREVLLAQLAGALAAPLQQLAGLMQALPRNLAYGLAALRDQKAAGSETGGGGRLRASRPSLRRPLRTEAPASDAGPPADAAARGRPLCQAAADDAPLLRLRRRAAEAEAPVC